MLLETDADRARDSAQHIVAHLVSVGIVDAFEMVHIDHDCRQLLLLISCLSPKLVKLFEKSAAIQTASQSVLGGQDLEFAVLAFDFIATDPQQAEHVFQFCSMLFDMRDVPKRG